MIPIKLDKESKRDLIRSVQEYFEVERSETIGDLGAEQLIDMILSSAAPHIYNKAVQDARKLVGQKLLQVEDDLYSLEVPVKRSR